MFYTCLHRKRLPNIDFLFYFHRYELELTKPCELILILNLKVAVILISLLLPFKILKHLLSHTHTGHADFVKGYVAARVG